MKYCCKRCGYETSIRTNLRAHLSRKKVCDPIYNDIPIGELRAEIDDNGEKIICYTCGKEFRHRQSKHRHMQLNHCKQKDQQIIELQDKVIELSKRPHIQNIQNNFIITLSYYVLWVL